MPQTSQVGPNLGHTDSGLAQFWDPFFVPLPLPCYQVLCFVRLPLPGPKEIRRCLGERSGEVRI